MHWPYIFFKAGKKSAEPEPQPPKIVPAPAAAPPAPAQTEPPAPPTIKPVPAAATGPAQPPPATSTQPKVVIQGPTAPYARPANPVPVTAPTPAPVKEAPAPGTRTLPAMHGVVLRQPNRMVVSSGSVPIGSTSAAVRPTTPLKNMEQLMAEADPVRTGAIRMENRPRTETVAPTQTPAADIPASLAAKAPEPVAPLKRAELAVPAHAPAPPNLGATTGALIPPPFPAFKPAASGSGKIANTIRLRGPTPPSAPPFSVASPVIRPTAPAAPTVPLRPRLAEPDSPFVLKPSVPAVTPAVEPEPIATPTPRIVPPPPPPSLPAGPVVRRRASLADVARIVLPPRRDETGPIHPTPSEPPSAVVPPAFPVTAMTARVSERPAPNGTENPAPVSAKVEEAKPEPSMEAKPAAAVKEEAAASPEVSPPPAASPEVPTISLFPETPKVDPEAHKPEPTAPPEPKIDPEAHKPEPVAVAAPKVEAEAAKAPPVPALEVTAPVETRERKEFHLTNGERVAGVVLSETPDSVYLEHGTLGVLTIPRTQIAKRLVEIILINGDRVVGDLMAETADTLYVRHASLGMLTVPRAQRSTRVVEAILKDGDRILGEVLTETDSFTVIRSATLGTITVPHNQISMLSRKLEQIQLKALPAPTTELKDKPA